MNRKIIILLYLLLTLPLISFAQKGNTDVEKAKSVPTVVLNCGIEMPIIGFGTLYLKDSIGVNSVAEAIACWIPLLFMEMRRN